MALTINSAPGSFFSAHGDLIFVVHEDVKAHDPNLYPDYKYVADIYVNGELVTRLRRVPQPDNKRGIFNIGQIVRDYVSAKFNPTPNTTYAQELGEGEFFVTVQVKFGEEYNFTLTTNILTDSARVYFNHYNGRLVGVNTNLTPYLDKALTVRPYENYVDLNSDNCFIPYFPSDTDIITLSIVVYNQNGAYYGGISRQYTPTGAFKQQLINVSPKAINSHSAGFITDGIKYYTVEFQTPNGSPDSKYKFTIDCDPRFKTYTLHFLNRFGGFESKDFNKAAKKTIDIEKKDFGKLPYQVDANGAVTYYNSNKIYHETRATYASQFSEKLTLNSDILSDEEYEWLSDLILSPLVYLEDGGYFIPVQIKSNNYDFKKRITDKLTNLTVEIELGNQLNTQYR